ncbi:uncharacterized protein METZ01_LOCUS248784 [marine metagenome]|uniref:DUF3566 domain-containing protein n=1 Tax=marine metagenome TaxID=408172 RepID=A0A382I8G5_9ZZZZ
MKKRINRISILQSSKIVTVLSALSGFIYTLIGIPMFAFGGDIMKDIALFYIAGPVWMAVFGFVFFVIFAAIYNILARRLGGIEVELNDE